MPAPTAPVRPVAYLTDVEGMWSKIESFAARSPHVRLDGAGALQVDERAIFVFGGDAIDRGPHGMRVVDALLDVKRRHPERVILLSGNRDLNKLRLVTELGGQPPQRAPQEVKLKGGATLLRWIFENTMGAKAAFEFRRDELRAAKRDTSDDAVVASYLEDLRPGGAQAELMARSQLAFRNGRTLYVHGGVTEENLGVTPGEPRAATVDAWVKALNGWYAGQLQAYLEGTLLADGEPGWSALVAYQAPLPGTRLNQGSVVYGRVGDALNNPELPPLAVLGTLKEQGISRLVVGHTPNGDTPSILRSEGFEFIVADTSHGRSDEAPALTISDAAIAVDGKATLDDGRAVAVKFTLHLTEKSFIGRRLPGSTLLVKGRLESGEYLLFRYAENYRYEQLAMSAAEIERRLG